MNIGEDYLPHIMEYASHVRIIQKIAIPAEILDKVKGEKGSFVTMLPKVLFVRGIVAQDLLCSV